MNNKPIKLISQLNLNLTILRFLKAMEQDSSNAEQCSSNATSDQTSSKHINLNTERNAPQIPSKSQQISPEKHKYEQSEQSHATPLPSKNDIKK